MRKSVAEGVTTVMLITLILLVSSVAFSMMVKYFAPSVRGLTNTYVFETSVSNVNSCFLNSAERCEYFLVVPLRTSVTLKCSKDGTIVSNGKKEVSIPFSCKEEKEVKFDRVGIYYVKLY